MFKKIISTLVIFSFLLQLGPTLPNAFGLAVQPCTKDSEVTTALKTGEIPEPTDEQRLALEALENIQDATPDSLETPDPDELYLPDGWSFERPGKGSHVIYTHISGKSLPIPAHATPWQLRHIYLPQMQKISDKFSKKSVEGKKATPVDPVGARKGKRKKQKKQQQQQKIWDQYCTKEETRKKQELKTQYESQINDCFQKRMEENDSFKKLFEILRQAKTLLEQKDYYHALILYETIFNNTSIDHSIKLLAYTHFFAYCLAVAPEKKITNQDFIEHLKILDKLYSYFQTIFLEPISEKNKRFLNHPVLLKGTHSATEKEATLEEALSYLLPIPQSPLDSPCDTYSFTWDQILDNTYRMEKKKFFLSIILNQYIDLTHKWIIDVYKQKKIYTERLDFLEIISNYQEKIVKIQSLINPNDFEEHSMYIIILIEFFGTISESKEEKYIYLAKKTSQKIYAYFAQLMPYIKKNPHLLKSSSLSNLDVSASDFFISLSSSFEINFGVENDYFFYHLNKKLNKLFHQNKELFPKTMEEITPFTPEKIQELLKNPCDCPDCPTAKAIERSKKASTYFNIPTEQFILEITSSSLNLLCKIYKKNPQQVITIFKKLNRKEIFYLIVKIFLENAGYFKETDLRQFSNVLELIFPLLKKINALPNKTEQEEKLLFLYYWKLLIEHQENRKTEDSLANLKKSFLDGIFYFEQGQKILNQYPEIHEEHSRFDIHFFYVAGFNFYIDFLEQPSSLIDNAKDICKKALSVYDYLNKNKVKLKDLSKRFVDVLIQFFVENKISIDPITTQKIKAIIQQNIQQCLNTKILFDGKNVNIENIEDKVLLLYGEKTPEELVKILSALKENIKLLKLFSQLVQRMPDPKDDKLIHWAEEILTFQDLHEQLLKQINQLKEQGQAIQTNA